jgi:hypothetical protein
MEPVIRSEAEIPRRVLLEGSTSSMGKSVATQVMTWHLGRSQILVDDVHISCHATTPEFLCNWQWLSGQNASLCTGQLLAISPQDPAEQRLTREAKELWVKTSKLNWL